MQSFIIFFIIIIIFLYFYGYYKYYVKNKNLPKCDIFYIKEDKKLLDICNENFEIINNVPDNYDIEFDNYYKLNTKLYTKDIKKFFSDEDYIFSMYPELNVDELMKLPQLKSFIKNRISNIERDSDCDDVDKFDFHGDGDYEFTDLDNDNILD